MLAKIKRSAGLLLAVMLSIAGQYPYVSGLTAKAAVAVAGGFADRADERRMQITRRRFDGFIEKMDAPPDYVVQPGDTLYVYECWL
jgi:polysaccharide export outer membrane protein